MIFKNIYNLHPFPMGHWDTIQRQRYKTHKDDIKEKQLDIASEMFYSVLYWITGISGSTSIVRGTWRRETPRVLISAVNLNNPSSLQYDVTSHRLL